MKFRTRITILLTLVFLFVTITPYLVLSSLGYRIDFENKKVVLTGGIYVKAQPTGTIITIDNKPTDPRGIFSDAVFVQNLLPKTYGLTIAKEGYYSYQKTLPVVEKAVTKLENVILFKNNPVFQASEDVKQFTALKQKSQERFIIKTSNLYYNNTPENANVTAIEKTTPVLRNVAAFTISDNSIVWYGLDGFLKKSSLQGKDTEVLSNEGAKPDVKKIHTLDIISGNTFLRVANAVSLFDPETKTFEDFNAVAKALKASPDGKKILYYNNTEVLLYDLTDNKKEKVSLVKAQESIGDAYWLNNDYIIFNTGNKIEITEVDYRGNVNTITLPTTLSLSDETKLNLTKPDIFFDQSNKTLYVLTQKKLITTADLLP